MKRKVALLSMLLGLLFVQVGVKAQIVYNLQISHTAVTTCSKITYSVDFANQNGGNLSTATIPIDINFEILLGVNPVAQFNCGGDPTSIFPVFAELSPNDITGGTVTSPSGFSNQSLQIEITPNSGVTSVHFEYDVYIDCSVLPQGSLNSSMFIQQTFTSGSGSLTLLGAPNEVSGNTYTNELGLVNLSQVPAYVEPVIPGGLIAYNEEAYLVFEYQNTGASATIEFGFNLSNPNSCNNFQLLNGLEYYKIDADNNLSQINSNIVTLDNGERIRIRQKIKITGCLPCLNIKGEFTWHCGEPLPQNVDPCTDCKHVVQSVVSLNESPTVNYEVSMIRNEPLDRLDNTCDSSAKHWNITFRNSGNATVPKTRFDLGWWLVANGYYLSWIDPGSVTYVFRDENGNVYDAIGSGQAVLMNENYSGIILDHFICRNSDVLKRSVLEISDLLPNHTVTVEFDVLRCCSQDDVLLNNPKSYNSANINLLFSKPCDANISTPTHMAIDASGTNNVRNAGDNAGITTNTNPGPEGGDLNLLLEFIPSVTDMSVESGQTFGGSSSFDVSLHGLFPSISDCQVLGITPNPISTTPVNAYLRVKIHAHQGLRIMSLHDDVTLGNAVNQNTLVPVMLYKENDNNDCIEENYYYYYPITTWQDVVDYLNNGKLTFNLISCCMAEIPTGFDVTFHLIRNPADCGGVFVVNPDTVQVADPNPPYCLIPLSSVSHNMQIHCPGCRAPGIIVDNYRLIRETLGFADSDNDGIADNQNNAPVQLTPNHPDYPLLDLNISQHGDILVDTMWAHFQEGDSTYIDPGGTQGYNYVQMLAAGHELDFLQLRRSFSQKETMGVHVIGYDLYIYPPNSQTPIFSMQISNTDNEFGLFLDESVTDAFIFTFERQQLELYQSSHGGTGFTGGFEEGQHYLLVTRYKVCGNFTNNNLLQCDIGNHFWLSGISFPNGIAPSQMPNTLPADQNGDVIFPVNFENDYGFWCETFGGIHFFTGSEFSYSILHPYYFPHGSILDDYSCTPGLQLITRARGLLPNGSARTIYNNEIRLAAYEPYEWMISPPPGYEIIGAEVYSRFSYYQGNALQQEFDPDGPSIPIEHLISGGNLPVSEINPITSPTIISIDNIPQNIPSHDVIYSLTQLDITDPNLSLTDLKQETILMFRLKILDSLCGVTSSFLNFPSITYAKFRDRQPLITAPPVCEPTDVTLTPVNADGMSIHTPAPDLNFQVASPINVGSHEICWTFSLSNPGKPAYNVYIGIPGVLNPGYGYLSNWTVHFNGQTIPINSDGFFNLGTFNHNPDAVIGTICATYDSCVNNAIIPINWGWNCHELPTTNPPIDDNTCNVNFSELEFHDITSDILISNINYPPNYSTCGDESSVSADFTNASTIINQSEVSPYEIVFSNLPVGASIASVTLQNCALIGSPNAPIVTLTGPAWSISPSDLNTLFDDDYNIPPDHPYMGGDQCLRVTVNYIFDCDYDGTLPDIYLHSLNYCGNLMKDTAVFNATWIRNPQDTCCIPPCESLNFNSFDKEHCTIYFEPQLPNSASCVSTSLIWNFGDGTTSSLTNPYHQYSVGGTYTVTLFWECFDSSGSLIDSCSISNTVVVKCVPCDQFSMTAIPHDKCWVLLQSNIPGSTGCVNSVVSWDFGDNTTGTGTSVLHEFPASGNYPVCYTFYCYDSHGMVTDSCRVCDTVTVDCNNSYTPCDSLSVTYNVLDDCTVEFNATMPATPGCSSSVMTWYFDNSGPVTGMNVIHNFSQGGGHWVYYSWICYANDSIPIDSCLGSVYIRLECDSSVTFSCDSLQLNAFQDSSCIMNFSAVVPNYPNCSSISYSWSFGDNSPVVYGGPNVSHQYATSGYYHVCYKWACYDSSGNMLNTCKVCKDIYVNCDSVVVDCEDVSFTLTQNNSCEVSFQSTTPNASGCASTSYFWYFGDGTSSTLQNPVHTYPNSGSYWVTFIWTCYDATGNVLATCDVRKEIHLDCVQDSMICLLVDNSGNKDIGEHIIPTPDGGCAVAGTMFKSSNPPDNDMYFIKYNDQLDFNSAIGLQIGGNLKEQGYSLLHRNHDGYYITGTVDVTETDKDIYVAKISESGTFMWGYRYGYKNGINEEARKIIDMSTSSENAILVVGFTKSRTSYNKALALKIDGNGSILTANTYFASDSSHEYTNDVARWINPDGRSYYFLVGEHIDSRGSDGFIIKIDQNLNHIASRLIDNQELETIANSVAILPTGTKAEIYIAGSVAKKIDKIKNVYVVKIDDLLTTSYTPSNTILNSGLGLNEYARSIQITSDKNLIIAGQQEDSRGGKNSGIVIKLKATDLSVLWSKVSNLTGDKFYRSITQLSNDSYVATGAYIHNSSDYDIYMSKISSDGKSCCLDDLLFNKNTTLKLSGFFKDERINLERDKYGAVKKYYKDKVICKQSINTVIQPVYTRQKPIANEVDGMRIFPNPNSGEFVIELSSAKYTVHSIKLYDLSGRMTRAFSEMPDSKSRFYISEKGLNSGLYIIEVSNLENKWKSKVVIAH